MHIVRRISSAGDALSQLCNVAFLPRPLDTNANESISGRSHREGWQTAAAFIDLLFFWDHEDGKGHCELAHQRDIERARDLLRSKTEGE